LSILATILHKNLKEAMISGLKRGMTAEIFTNGKKSHTAAEPLPVSAGWFASLPDLDDMLQAGATGFELMNHGDETGKFLHRKLAIFDDTVIFGSHNLTIASTVTQDEVSFEVQSADFVDRMLKISRHSTQVNGALLDIPEVHQERLSTPYRQWFSSFLGKIYCE
jgi:putative cardiolipin synthase